MEIRGKLVILFIFGLAGAAAAFAWTFQYMRGRRVLDLWGAQTARLIRVDAERIDVLALEPSGELVGGKNGQSEQLEIDGRSFAIRRRKDISQARGLVHARQALIEDASFAWEKQRGDCPPDWEYALEFHRDERIARVLIDTHCQRARLLESGKEVSIEPIFKGLMKFLGENLEADSDSPANPFAPKAEAT